ncbi:YcaO-like family protein [Streptomyces sp. UNOC14_S4]|uniref:YcaO-like family protein n=1 Tax=Streptomyces sp. UNOC14_S4 TaxID=2872340 RepID=UPI001E4A889A|nr:YcaO-like family protein [Streptomyces sp. UNOC14_S4]MCC3770092.1 YcaO-like family protein [Streptomyces sp. UNOC14_S4]
MIDQDSVLRIAPGVRLHVLDDRNGFVESPRGVHRLEGTGLRLLAEQVLPRLAAPARAADIAVALRTALPRPRALELLEGLREQGIVEYAPPEPRHTTRRRVGVLGPAALTRDLLAVLRRTPRAEPYDLGEPGEPTAALRHAADAGLVVVATASLFDARAGAVNELCVRQGLPCLFYGLMHGGAAFAGPLWTPDRPVACYECLRTRIFANSVHGPVWRAYTSSLAESGAPAVQQQAPPWTAARLAAALGRRVADLLARPGHDPGDPGDPGDPDVPDDPGGELLWLDQEGDETRRFVLPVPTCRVCGSRQRAAAADPETTAPGTAGPEAVLTLAVDDRVGAVHTVNVRRAESGPQIYLAGSTSPDHSLIRPNLGVVRNGGAGFTKQEALHAAIGESLERYAAGLFRSAELRTASWTELTRSGGTAVAPGTFGLFSAEQYASPGFPFAPFTEDTPVRWVRATRLPDGAACWVPASQVFLHYRRAREETPIAPSISTGLAAGPTTADAVLGGLCEIVERDALAVSWLHRLPPRPVPEEVIAASPRVRYHLTKATSWRVRFYDLSLDLTPPVVVAVMDYRGGAEPVLSFGSACRMAPVHALEKAFLEAAQGLTYVRRLVKEYEGFEAAPDFANVDEFNKHAILYTRHPELRRRAGYLVHPDAPPACDRPARLLTGAAEATDTAEDGAASVDFITEELAAAGFRTYVVDLTTPDTRRAGVRVVRVLVPGLQHLSGAHRFRMLGNPRLRDVVRTLGHHSAPDNPYPHPLP